MKSEYPKHRTTHFVWMRFIHYVSMLIHWIRQNHAAIKACLFIEIFKSFRSKILMDYKLDCAPFLTQFSRFFFSMNSVVVIDNFIKIFSPCYKNFEERLVFWSQNDGGFQNILYDKKWRTSKSECRWSRESLSISLSECRQVFVLNVGWKRLKML